MDSVTSEDADESVEVAKAHIRERGERIRRRKLERALQRLREHENLSEEDEQAVRDLARRLTEQLLAVPQSQLDSVAATEPDRKTARQAMALFGDD